MKHNVRDLTIDKMRKMLEDGTLTWDESIQRAKNAWGPLQKSELIHSLLGAYYIPSICLHKTTRYDITKDKDIIHYSVIDGKQRLSVIFEFMDNGFKLHKKTPNLKLANGEEIELRNKKFSQLSEELQSDIKRYIPNIYAIEGYTAEEVEMMFFRLNNGTPLTKVQQSRAVLGSARASFINSLLEAPFFEKCKLSTFQKKREDNLSITLQGLMLIDESYTWQTFGAKEISNYCEYLKDNFSIELQCKIVDAIRLLNDIFCDENVIMTQEKEDKAKTVDFLKRINVPIIIKAASVMSEYDIDVKMAFSFFTNFFDEGSEDYVEYQKYCGDGSISKAKVNGRVETMLFALRNATYLKMVDENRRTSDTLTEVKELLENEEGAFIPREYILG